MNFATKSLAAIAVLAAATAATATEGVQDPVVKARQDLMGTIGMNVKTLGDMAGGKAPFDAAAAAAAKAALEAAAADIPVKFETQADDPKSRVIVDKLWADFEGFKAQAAKLGAAATALDVASVESIQAGMGAVGGVCRDCHTAYRADR